MSAHICDTNTFIDFAATVQKACARNRGFQWHTRPLNTIPELWEGCQPGQMLPPPSEKRNELLAEATRKIQGYATPAELQHIIEIMYRANVASVNWRYDEIDESAAPRWSKHGHTLAPLNTPIATLAALQTWEYQACEPPSFYNSEARQLAQAIRTEAIRQLLAEQEAETP